MIETYAEYGAIGCIIMLFGYMVLNLMSSQKSQNEDLDNIRVHISKMETKVQNVESIILKMLERWQRSDDTTERRHEKLIDEINQISDVVAEVKGSVSRINGKH